MVKWKDPLGGSAHGPPHPVLIWEQSYVCVFTQENDAVHITAGRPYGGSC